MVKSVQRKKSSPYKHSQGLTSKLDYLRICYKELNRNYKTFKAYLKRKKTVIKLYKSKLRYLKLHFNYLKSNGEIKESDLNFIKENIQNDKRIHNLLIADFYQTDPLISSCTQISESNQNVDEQGIEFLLKTQKSDGFQGKINCYLIGIDHSANLLKHVDERLKCLEENSKKSEVDQKYYLKVFIVP